MTTFEIIMNTTLLPIVVSVRKIWTSVKEAAMLLLVVALYVKELYIHRYILAFSQLQMLLSVFDLSSFISDGPCLWIIW